MFDILCFRCDIWCLIFDTWYFMFHIWYWKFDTLYLIFDTWYFRWVAVSTLHTYFLLAMHPQGTFAIAYTDSGRWPITDTTQAPLRWLAYACHRRHGYAERLRLHLVAAIRQEEIRVGAWCIYASSGLPVASLHSDPWRPIRHANAVRYWGRLGSPGDSPTFAPYCAILACATNGPVPGNTSYLRFHRRLHSTVPSVLGATSTRSLSHSRAWAAPSAYRAKVEVTMAGY